MPRRVIEQPTLQDPILAQRSPFEVFLLTLGVLLGITQLVGYPISAALNNAVGMLVTNCWALMLAFGCGMALTGTLWVKSAYTGLLIERSGMLLVGGAALIYTLLILFFSPDHRAYSVGINLAFGSACLWRAVQITRRFRWARQVARERSKEDIY